MEIRVIILFILIAVGVAIYLGTRKPPSKMGE